MTEIMTQELLSETKDGVLTLTLNRPDVLNALTMGMMKGITDSLKKAATDKTIKAVILTAPGEEAPPIVAGACGVELLITQFSARRSSKA